MLQNVKVVILAMKDRYKFQQEPLQTTKLLRSTKTEKSGSISQGRRSIINICAFPFGGELS